MKQQEVYGLILKLKQLILNADIANNNNFKSFEQKAELLGNIEADRANEILKNVTTLVPLKYLSHFWRSLEMSLTNCKTELKLIMLMLILVILFLL